MAVVLFRIDDRLIHGQVVEGWLSKVDAQVLLVANDMVANDIMQKTLMQMAVPLNVEILINTVDDILSKYKSGNYDNKKVFILVSSPKDAFKLIDGGIKVPSINVGGIHYSEGKMQILEFLSVDDEDCKYFHLIDSKNVKIEGRPLPDFEKVDVLKEICKFEKSC